MKFQSLTIDILTHATLRAFVIIMQFKPLSARKFFDSWMGHNWIDLNLTRIITISIFAESSRWLTKKLNWNLNNEEWLVCCRNSALITQILPWYPISPRNHKKSPLSFSMSWSKNLSRQIAVVMMKILVSYILYYILLLRHNPAYFSDLTTEDDLIAVQDKTNRYLRLREFLHEQSMESDLIVMTLPMPRKNIVSAPVYMAWLESMSRGMPPFLFVRGNQSSVLTFYS